MDNISDIMTSLSELPSRIAKAGQELCDKEHQWQDLKQTIKAERAKTFLLLKANVYNPTVNGEEFTHDVKKSDNVCENMVEADEKLHELVYEALALESECKKIRNAQEGMLEKLNAVKKMADLLRREQNV